MPALFPRSFVGVGFSHQNPPTPFFWEALDERLRLKKDVEAAKSTGKKSDG